MGLDYLAMVSATWQIQLHAYHHMQVLESRQGGAMSERPARLLRISSSDLGFRPLSQVISTPGMKVRPSALADSSPFFQPAIVS